jgi:3-oxoacyl-[acyl-carrier-protein] synthase-1
MRGEAIVVTGIGMRTAVGQHAEQSCASVRAGLNRFMTWQHFGVDGGGLTASWTRPDLGERSWCEKLVELVRAPLAEALWSARLFDLPIYLPHSRKQARVQLFLGTPPLNRPGPSPEELEEFTETLTEDLFPEGAIRLEFIHMEQVSGLAGVARACEVLQQGAADICLVGAADSLLDSVLLQSLLEAGRLKVPGISSGIIPGEAAAFLVLERESMARRRGIPPRLCIDAVGLEREAPWTPQGPVGGRGLTRAIQTVLESVGRPEDFGHVLCDLNGERWRFLEWALIETRCLGKLPRGWRLWHPADCLGDIGAAFGPVAIGLAAHAFRRGYAPRPRILIASASERGERAALAVSRMGEH